MRHRELNKTGCVLFIVIKRSKRSISSGSDATENRDFQRGKQRLVQSKKVKVQFLRIGNFVFLTFEKLLSSYSYFLSFRKNRFFF